MLWTPTLVCGVIISIQGVMMGYGRVIVKITVIGLIQLGLVLTSAAAHSKISDKITITTFNLKWYGLGGGMWNDPSQEYRQEKLFAFFKQELAGADLVVFTEVVKVEEFTQLVRNLWDCETYTGGWSRHQHVVTCYKPESLRLEQYDDDWIIEEVDLGSLGLRPATQVKVCHRQGHCFLQVIGLHLVAGPKTEKRIRQVEHLRDHLRKQKRPLPTVITGDLNSYFQYQSGLQKDDIDFFEDILSQNKNNFRSVTRHIRTYNSGNWARSYDHIIVTDNIKVKRTWGYEACQEEQDFRKQFIPYPSFSKYFSDHCPVSAELEI
jgi:endonuclease/exonuclease/phosphatase family metal-dependent hydrolase